jgi:PAT family beta-lactamase induction signal transducer AmpG
VGASIAGAMAGGWYTGKKGVYTALWQLGLLQAVSNLGYAMVSALGGGKLALFSASFAEHFSGGLGSAAELVLLTQLCDREHAATQYAALTCLFSATRVLVGSQSGIAVEFMGFTPFFFLTFALSFVCFLFLPGVKRRLRC